jgi:hypothetical protein
VTGSGWKYLVTNKIELGDGEIKLHPTQRLDVHFPQGFHFDLADISL